MVKQPPWASRYYLILSKNVVEGQEADHCTLAPKPLCSPKHFWHNPAQIMLAALGCLGA